MIAPVLQYAFTPRTRQIVLKSVAVVDTSRIQYIINATRNITLYNYSTPTSLTTDGTNIVTVSTSCAGMLYTDELNITYDYPLEPLDQNRYFL